MTRPSHASTAQGWPRVVAEVFAQFVAFATLLFLTRFVARGHLVPQMDQECHIGGIAAELLQHGLRFPLMVYSPNEYDNGSFFSGLAAAGMFTLLGQSVLAIKLVTHTITAAGAVAALCLLRSCLAELSLASRRERRIAAAALVITLALAPRVVTVMSMHGVGNHAEGTAIDLMLLALFMWRLRARSVVRVAGFWTLVGLGLYLNKGTFLVVIVLGLAEFNMPGRSRVRVVSAAGGFALGILPEVYVLAQRQGIGWLTISGKAGRNSEGFPRTFLGSLWTLADEKLELALLWSVAIIVGSVLAKRSWLRFRAGRGATPPVALSVVIGFLVLHLAALTMMAKSGLDAYVIYAYPPLAVLVAVLTASLTSRVAHRVSGRAGTWVAAAALTVLMIVNRPDAWHPGFAKVSFLWHNRLGAVCAWRFAEGFEREYRHGLAPPGRTEEAHAIWRCRSLTGGAQVADCIGGIARELNWRRQARVHGEPPAGLTEVERRAYAFQYGTHRHGDTRYCRDFVNPALQAACGTAVQLDCLVFADIYTGFSAGQNLRSANCEIAEPPIDGYWSQQRWHLLHRTGGTALDLSRTRGDDDLSRCRAAVDRCYPRRP